MVEEVPKGKAGRFYKLNQVKVEKTMEDLLKRIVDLLGIEWAERTLAALKEESEVLKEKAQEATPKYKSGTCDGCGEYSDHLQTYYGPHAPLGFDMCESCIKKTFFSKKEE